MPLTDVQRRVIGHLSIPHNPTQLAIDCQPHVDLPAEDIDLLLRGDLSDNGWVVNVGDHDHPAKTAAAAQKHKQTIPMADEQCQIFEQRRQPSGRFGWRHKGELWMLSNEGLEAIKAPLEVSRGPLTPSEIQGLVNQEWARTIKEEYKPGVHSLSTQLLPEEFANWFKVTADACAATWGEGSRPVAPLGGGSSGYSDAYEVSLLKAENQQLTLGAVADPWYFALSILAFNDADTGTTADDGSHKPTYTGYARKNVGGADMNAASGSAGSVTNANAIIFAACTLGTSTILSGGNCVASTLDVLRKWGDIGSTDVSITQTPPQFAAGAYTTSTT